MIVKHYVIPHDSETVCEILLSEIDESSVTGNAHMVNCMGCQDRLIASWFGSGYVHFRQRWIA